MVQVAKVGLGRVTMEKSADLRCRVMFGPQGCYGALRQGPSGGSLWGWKSLCGLAFGVSGP